MPRNMSFALTTSQFRARSKLVTRRFGWWFLNPGDVVMGVEKAMGLKPGETVVRLGLIRIESTRPEPLNAITPEDLILEGFPELTTEGFIQMMCLHNGVSPDETVNRIRFSYIEGNQK